MRKPIMSSLDGRRGRLGRLTRTTREDNHDRAPAHQNKGCIGRDRSGRLLLVELSGDIEVLFDRLPEQIDLEL